MGYSPTQKGYKCYHPLSRKILVSKDVTFVENQSFFQSSTSSPKGEVTTISDHDLPIMEVSQPYQPHAPPNLSTLPTPPNSKTTEIGDQETSPNSPPSVQTKMSLVRFKGSSFVYKRKEQPNPCAK